MLAGLKKFVSAMVYGEMALREASLHLLASILEFFATLARMTYKHMESNAPVDIKAPSASIGREADSAAETRVEEGDGEEDL